MIQNIGLMMTCNEEDIIEETLDSLRPHFDHILVLDGSTDRTEEIIRSYSNISYFLKDQDLYPKRRTTDGCRQFLLEKAQELFPIEGWFTLLHADEIFVDNPNAIAQRAEKQGAEKVNWHVLSFFLHNDEKNTPDDPKKTIQENRRYYQAGGLEVRQFKNKQGIYYPLSLTNRVFPNGIGWQFLWDYPILKQYPIRSVEQLQKKHDNAHRMVHFGHPFEPDSAYRSHYYTDRKRVRIYNGSFEELEPGNRPSFLTQYLTWQLH